MKRYVGIIAIVVVLTSCPNPHNTGEEYSPGPPISSIDPAFWFKDIYTALVSREPAGGFPVGQIATCQYVCDAINAKRGAGTVTPVPGTEAQPANCEYLLKVIDACNSGMSSFGTSSYAIGQLLDTIAVDNALTSLLGAGRFVAIGNGVALYSLDGLSWTLHTIPVKDLQSVAYGNGRYVAIGHSNAAYSLDGLNWTCLASMPDSRIPVVAYGNGVFVAASDYPSLVYSTDGIVWSSADLHQRGIAFGNGMFVSTGSYPYTSAVSTDGITWKRGQSTDYIGYAKMAYGNGIFITTGTINLGPAFNHFQCKYSTDGLNWANGGNYARYEPQDVTYGNGVFVAVGSSDPNTENPYYPQILYSSDGISWENANSPNFGANQQWQGVAYGDGKFVAVGGNCIATSDNGIDWTQVEVPAGTNQLMTVCSGGY